MEFLTGRPVASGTAFTDFTVKVEATGLKPDIHYVFRFADCTNSGSVSDVGRTRTIASSNSKSLILSFEMVLMGIAPASQVNGGKPLTLVVFLCSNFPNGYFNAYHVAIQNTSADIFIHLGDYVRPSHTMYISSQYTDTHTQIYESLGSGAKIGRAVLGRELATIHS